MRKAGFTLLEMSVVLVIIALIVGGVMVGKDLTEAAAIRSQLTQVDKLRLAVGTFKLKYNCLPGDCSQTVQLGIGTIGALHNGNADGRIGEGRGPNSCQLTNWNREALNSYLHLFRAGLLDAKGTFVGYEGNENTCMPYSNLETKLPQAVIGNRTLVYMGDIANVDHGANGQFVRNAPRAFALGRPSETFQESATVLIEHSQMMDLKIDDGLPVSGNVGLAPLGAVWTGFVPKTGTVVGPHNCIMGTYQATLLNCANVAIQGGRYALLVFMNQY